jgi:hypothetical protein
MSSRCWKALGLMALAAVAVPSVAGAQAIGTPEGEWCQRSGDEERGYFCEVRETTLAAPSAVAVDATPNGGIRAQGWDRGEMLVRMRVAARAGTDAEARDLVSAVRIESDGGRIRATGPKTGDGTSWSASYEVFLPTRTDLRLESRNGGIALSDLAGTLQFETTNGGVHLENLAGNVRGHTTNGGLVVKLGGTSWDGEGLDVRTTNGGVRILVPEGYSAHLETRTTNGGMQVGFPVTVQGRFGKEISVDLGSGGRTIRAATINGGVSLQRP